MGECPLDPGGNDSVDPLNVTIPSSDEVQRLKFVAYGVISPCIIALGILGNLTNLAVLTRPQLRGVTFVYLSWLAISDLLTLLVSLSSMMRLRGAQSHSRAAAFYYAHIEMPLVNALMASSVFLVVALTVDRYFSVCLPTRFKEVHNAARARRSICAAYACATLLYVPVGFQKQPVALSGGGGYVACDNPVVVRNAAFRGYLVVKEAAVRLGPVVLLAVLNTAIIVAFRRTLRRRREMLNMSAPGGAGTTPHHQTVSGKKYREERRLVVLLGGVSVLFLVSMTPAAVLTILNSDEREHHFGFQAFRAVANVLELSNYAMNFYVYCMCSSEIRRTFVALVTCTRPTTVGSSSGASSKPSLDSNNKF